MRGRLQRLLAVYSAGDVAFAAAFVGVVAVLYVAMAVVLVLVLLGVL